MFSLFYLAQYSALYLADAFGCYTKHCSYLDISAWLRAVKPVASYYYAAFSLVKPGEDSSKQASGLRTAVRNVQDGISVVQVAEGSMTEIHSMLNRMRDLAVQAANTGANDATAVTAAQAELDALVLEIGHIASETEFAGVKLLDGSYTAKTFQVGAASGDTVAVTINDMDATALTVNALTLNNAASAITDIDAAIAAVSAERGSLGALQNRFESMINNLQVSVENLTASESRIRDADMASEMITFTRNQILQQAGMAMLAKAHSGPQSVLKLLQ